MEDIKNPLHGAIQNLETAAVETASAQENFQKDYSANEDAEMVKRRKTYTNILNLSNIPPRYRPAELGSNCKRYESMDGKAIALELALELAATGFIAEERSNKHALFLCGFFGVGKTWLATAILKWYVWYHLDEFSKNNLPAWTKFHAMIREVQACYSPAATQDTLSVIRKYQKAPFLVIDDVGDMEAGGETEDRRRILYEVIDYRNDYQLPTTLTSNLDPDQMTGHFGARSMQRIIELCSFEQMGGENLREAKAA